MKLVKINKIQYVIVDDSEIKEGDWFYNPEKNLAILQSLGGLGNSNWKKIIHSTEPLEHIGYHVSKGWMLYGLSLIIIPGTK